MRMAIPQLASPTAPAPRKETASRSVNLAVTSPAVKATGQIYSHTRRVIYADCTVGNHIYYSRYFDLLEEARGEFFRSLGFSLRQLAEEGFAFPVIHCIGRFLAPARYDDLLRIELHLESLGRIKLECAGRILSETGQLLFEGATRHACVDESDAPTRIPDALNRQLAPFLVSPALSD